MTGFSPAAVVDPSAQRRKEYMDLLFDNVPENILIFDGEGRLARCTSYFLRLAGIERFEQVVGWHFTRLYQLFGDENSIRSAIERFAHVKEGRKTCTNDVLFNFAAQREERLYTVHSAPMLTKDNRLDGVIVVFHDSTEYLSQEANERTHAMLDATPLACSFWDEELNLIDCNHECLILFGLASKKEYIRRFQELSPEFQPDGRPSHETLIAYTRLTFQTGRQAYEWQHCSPTTGRSFPTEVVLVRVPWKEGYRVVSYVRDVSEIREAEEHSRELEVQTRAAKVASETKSQFLAKMSHEIRTPMNAIIGMSELIRTNNLDDTQKEFINDIRKMSHSLLHIINDILDFSKVEAGRLDLAPVHFDLRELYDNICSINRFAAESNQLNFTASFAPDVPHVLYGDDVRMRQVITNIFGNAIKYTRHGGVDFKVECVVLDGKDWLSFTITDTGIGIRQEDIPRLFDTFAQFDLKANRAQSGTGLGLPITQSLVKLMQGRIEVHSEYGQGSTFTILLPLTLGDPAQVEIVVRKRPEFRASDAKVLVVDDNKINLKVALAHLANYGIQADIAMSGREAITRVERKDYDLVFMDQMMSEMDGLEATQKIRALGAEKYHHLPIVALTANAVRGAKQIFLAAGMNDFISKPINSNELSHILMKWLPAEKVVASACSAHPVPSIAPSDAILPTSAPVVQREIGLKNAARDESLYRQLLADFLRDHADDATRLRAHLAAGERADAHRIAHTLKNVAATIGALDLRQTAAHLETALKDKLQDDAPTDLLNELETRLATVTSELTDEAGDVEPRPAPSAEAVDCPDPAPDPGAALALLDKLDPLLENGNTAALEFTTDIERLLSPLNEHCALLIQQIEDFDFTCARQTSLSIRSILNAAPTHGRVT